MSQVSKFFNLSMVEQRLLVKAVILLWIIRLGQWLLPFQTLCRLLNYVSNKQRSNNSFPQDKIAWAVGAVSRYVLKATCLTRALAAQVLLQQEGYQAILRIGVNKSKDDDLQAHAWVESQGKILIGGSELGSYTTLISMEEMKQ
jgi:hypothetical protein